jgi:hypothetical protein
MCSINSILKPGRDKNNNEESGDDKHHQSPKCCALIHVSKLEKLTRRVADLLGRVDFSIPRVFLRICGSADEIFHQTIRQLFFGKSKHVVISPVTIDVYVALLEPFIPKTQLLYDS